MPIAITVIFTFFIFISANSQTQTVKIITIEDAISTALINNIEIQSKQLNIQSLNVLKKSVLELPKANINFQFGQYNSINQDLAIQISQSFPFPTYFSAKSNLIKAELQGVQLQKEATEKEIKAQVQYWFYQMHYLQIVKKQMQSMDSLFKDFVNASALRYKTGEANILEKTTAETKYGQFSLLLKQKETDYSIAYNSLKTLMNTSEEFTITENKELQILVLNNSIDTNLVANNPMLKELYQQAIIAEQNKKLETASTLPDFNVGYFNQSLIGVQNINGTDINFDGSKRFQGFNVGLSIPITFFSNSSKIKSLSFKQQALQKEADNVKLLLQNELLNAFLMYNQQLLQYNYYKSFALPNAQLIINTSKLSFKSGDIGYIEYLQALQTASDIRLNYLETVNQINQTIININYLISK